MNYQQAADYIFSYTDYEKEPMPHRLAGYDLRRVEELLARLGAPHLGAKSVHIAGTNGKGSVAAMVAAELSCSGYVTGLYTSPHLHTWRERMRVDGEMISEDEFVALVEKVEPEVEAVNREGTYGRLTTFELLTALGFAHFKQKGVEFQVLEVGMGGQFDATNVVHPEVCILTSIDLDHTQVLGSSLAEVAGEKAGIIKPGCVVVTAPQSDEAARVVAEACQARGARLVRVGTDVTWQGLGFDYQGQSLQVKGRLGDYRLSIPLLGQHQLENAAVAVAALEVLLEKGFRVCRESIIRGLAGVKWSGRLQVFDGHPVVVIDGAHNPGAARRLRESLEYYFKLPVKGGARAGICPFERAVLVIGVSGDKDIAGIARELAPPFDKVIVTRSRHPRAMEQSAVMTEFIKHGAEVKTAEGIPSALALAADIAGSDGLVCVAGSLFVVGEALEQAHNLTGGAKG